ncbi:MAG: HIT family protein [Nanoarchaeota archaeon]|nr:HIT family protein [Nanoarchaeota archaeon]
MTGCEYCDVKEKIIYEDDKVVAFLPANAIIKGHIKIVPKEHYRIYEEVPDETVTHIFQVSNKLSALVFETLSVQGTNIVVQNGIPGQEVPHFSVDVIPRVESDGLNFVWEAQKFSEDELQGFGLLIKEGLEGKSKDKKENKKQEKKKVKDELNDIETIEQEEDEENYLIKQLDRMP